MRGTVWIVLLAAACTDPAPSGKDGNSDVPNTDGVPTDTDTDAPPDDPPPAGATVIINEIMPGNGSTINAPGGCDVADWVELVNTGDEPVEVSRLQLRNDASDVWVGTEYDGVIEPGEYFLVWLGYQDDDEGVWTGWSVGKEDDELILISDNAVVIQEVAWEGIGEDISYARIPDVTGEFVPTAWATPFLENGDAASPTLEVADETVFRTDVVHRIDFEIDRATRDMLDQGDRPEVHAPMTIDGVCYDDVGLKLKGSASYDTMDGKPAFIVDMNEWVLGTRFRSLQAFKLHNGNVLDPTRVRDHITYTLARESGLLAPRIGWAEVYFNDVYYGIYIFQEKHDEQMIERWRPGDGETGMIFEPNESQAGWGDFGQGNILFNYEEGPEPLPQAGMDALLAADNLIGGPATDDRVAELWNHFNKDMFLTYMAWETVVMHTDGYRAPNNWRVYINGTTNLIELVPSGAEWTWDFPVDTFNSNGAASRWCLQNQGCKHDYAEKVLVMADKVEELDLLTEFQTVSEWLDPLIQSDPRYNSWETPATARLSTVQQLGENPGRARQQVYQTFPDLQP